MQTHLVGVIGLVVVFVIGTLRPVNLGALGLAATFLVGTFVAGENVRAMLGGFPVDLLVLLTGVTYLFGIAANNGTVALVVETAARLMRRRPALIPWVVFAVASLPAMAGALGSAGVALLAPIALRLARRHDIDRRLVGLMLIHGAAAGNFSPLNVLAAIVRQAAARDGVELSSARLSHQSSLDVFAARGGTLPRRPPAPRVTEVRAGDAIDREGWRVTVGRAAHVQPHLECLAFRLDADDGAICYSGDSGTCEELVDLARSCDVLIQMNHYFSGTEPSPAYRAACGNHRDNAVLARRAGVKALVLTHVLGALDAPWVRERIAHEIQQEFDGTVIWGEDLLRLRVSGRGGGVQPAAGPGESV